MLFQLFSSQRKSRLRRQLCLLWHSCRAGYTDSTWRPLTDKSHVTMDHFRPLYVGDTVPEGLWQLCAPDDWTSETDSSFIKSDSRWVAVILWQHCWSTVSDLTIWRQSDSLFAWPFAGLLFESVFWTNYTLLDDAEIKIIFCMLIGDLFIYFTFSISYFVRIIKHPKIWHLSQVSSL